jgi:histidyl-tRNA synthetase
MQKPSLPKGTRDFLPETMLRRKYLLSTIETVFRKFGFLPIETPALENLSTLTGKYGEEGDKLLFKVLNSGDFISEVPETSRLNGTAGELLKWISDKGLRYDLTVPLARFVVQHRNDLQMPFRRYQMQPVWRADKPQKGRYREFWQCDADVIGTDSLVSECDLLKIYEEVFGILNLDVKVQINNRKILEGFSEVMGAQEKFRLLTIIIDKLDKIGLDGVKQDLKANQFDDHQIAILTAMLQSFELTVENLNKLKISLKDSSIGLKGIAEMENLLDLTAAAGLNIPLTFNGALARGLDYYTGCIFEVTSNEVAIGSISGGGRYDNLTGIFGMDGLSGVGISFGIDRIYDTMESLGRFKETDYNGTKIICCHFDEKGLMEGLRSATVLRDFGIAAEVYPDTKKIQKQFEYANKRGIPYVIIWGEEELKNNIPQLKNMKTGEQKMMKIEEIPNYIS